MSRGHVIHVCGWWCGASKREDTGCFGELGGLRSVYVNSGSLALAVPWALVTGTALADQMSYLSKTMRLRVSKALLLYGPGCRRCGVGGRLRTAARSRRCRGWWWW